MAYITKMDLRIKLAKISTASLYGVYILALTILMLSLNSCSIQLETSKKIRTYDISSPFKKPVDSKVWIKDFEIECQN
jgi:hypothetical protein